MTKARIEVITSVQRRRRWSRAEKERILTVRRRPIQHRTENNAGSPKTCRCTAPPQLGENRAG